MIIERDKNYKCYFVVSILICTFLFFVYVCGFHTTFEFSLLINFPIYLLLGLELISYGRTFILDEKGCTVCFWKYRKRYTWDELITKRIESHILTTRSSPCPKEIIAAPYKIRKPRWIRVRNYGFLRPFSIIYFSFALEDQNLDFGRYYEVDEAIFREKMNEWGVEWEEAG